MSEAYENIVGRVERGSYRYEPQWGKEHRHSRENADVEIECLCFESLTQRGGVKKLSAAWN